MEATVGQKIGRTDENVASLGQTRITRLECGTHKKCKSEQGKTVQTNNEKIESNEKRVQSRALW
jgi:hypothetical protein